MLFYKPEEYLLPNFKKSQPNDAAGMPSRQDAPSQKDISLPNLNTYRRSHLTNQPVPEQPPKFVRDSMDVRDISGSSPRKMFKGVPKQLMEKYSDVFGAKSRRVRVRYDYNYMNYDDVVGKRGKSPHAALN